MSWFATVDTARHEAFVFATVSTAQEPPNALRFTRAAPIDRDVVRVHLDAKIATILSTRSGVGCKRLFGGNAEEDLWIARWLEPDTLAFKAKSTPTHRRDRMLLDTIC